ncbi:MAG: SulP family inorganic anion transporter [Pseudomonadota bacterium]
MSNPLLCNVTLIRWLPFLRWFQLVNAGTLRADVMAGLTGAVIVLPQGVAFAMIAGLPPEYGLYTAIIPPIIAALFGSSYHLISGPTTAISIVVFSTISPLAEAGSAHYITLVLTLTFIAGLFQLALGLARMGTLVNFVSHTVVVGFTAGAAILIATSQMKHFFGVEIPRGESFAHTLLELGQKVPDANLYVVAVALTTLISAIVFKKLLPRWPNMLLAMIVGAVLALVLGAEEHGIALVGELPGQLPPLSSPDFSLTTLKELAPGAFAVALLGLVEAVSIARSVASKSHQRIDGNQEFIGQGLANMFGSFFSSYASSGSFTRTGVNYTAGARTPMAAITAAISLALILLLIAPLTAYLPIPAMAGILLLVAYNLIDWHHIHSIVHTSRAEAGVLATTFFATLFLELEFAIYAGVMLSLIMYLSRTSRPKITTMAPDPSEINRPMINTAREPLDQCPQLRIVRMDGSLFFGAVNHASGQFRNFTEESPEQKHILLLCNSMNFIDVAGAEWLMQEANRLKENGGGLYLCNVKDNVCEFLRKSGLVDAIGEENIFDSKSEAIQCIFLKLQRDICRRCERRIFQECQSVPVVKAA